METTESFGKLHGKYNFTGIQRQKLELNDPFFTNDILNKAEIWIDYSRY